MGEFVLRPAKLVQTRLIADQTKPSEALTLKELVARLTPNGDAFERTKLGYLRAGCYVGVSKSRRSERQVVFVLGSNGGPGDLSLVIKKDPSVPSRILQAYLVESTGFEKSVEEPEGVLDVELDR